MIREGSNSSFAFFTASGRILAMLAGFAMPVFLTRFLSVEDYGTYSQFYTILGFAGTLFAFGIPSNLYYFYPRSVGNLKACIGNTILALLLFSLLAFGIIIIPATSRVIISNDSLRKFTEIIALAVFFCVPTHIIYPQFVIRKDKFISVLFPPLEIILKLVLVIASALVWNSLDAILLSILVLQFLIFAFSLIYSIHPYIGLPAKWIDFDLFLKQFVYILPFGLSVVLFTLFNRFDKLLCIKYIEPTEYAIYSVAFFGIPGINQVYDSLTEVNLLEMTKTHKKGDIRRTLKIYQDFTSKLLSFSLPVIFAVLLYSRQIFTVLFPLEYLSAVPYFRIFVLSFIFGAFGPGTVLRATGNTRYTLRSYLLTAIIFIPFSLISIRLWGTGGAIATAMIGAIVPKLFSIHFERKILGVSFSRYMPWDKFLMIFLISLAAVIPFALTELFLPDSGIWYAFIGGIFYVSAVYIIEFKIGLFLDIRKLRWLK